MKTEIISQVAQIVRQNQLNKGSIKKPSPSMKHSPDVVELSSVAKNPNSAQGLEQEQKLRVERIKSLVKENHYQMDDKVVESIAGNIAKIFVP